jgi:hypothetical protein
MTQREAREVVVLAVLAPGGGGQRLNQYKGMYILTYCCSSLDYDDMVLSLTSFGMRVKNGKDTSYHFQSFDFIWDRPTMAMFVNINIEQPPQSNELTKGPLSWFSTFVYRGSHRHKSAA